MEKWKECFKKIFYCLLSMFSILFSLSFLYEKILNKPILNANPSVYGWIWIFGSSFIGFVVFLSVICEKKFKKNNNCLKFISGIYIKIMLILISPLNISLYFAVYDRFLVVKFKDFLCIIIIFVILFLVLFFILSVYLHRQGIMNTVFVVIFILIFSFLIGMLTFTNLSLEVCLSLFGLIFTAIRNIENFIDINRIFPKEIHTKNNNEIRKKNKDMIKSILGILLLLVYVVFLILEIDKVNEYVLNNTGLSEVNLYLAKGIVRMFMFEMIGVLLLGIYLIFRKQERGYLRGTDSDVSNILNLYNRVILFGINREVISPEVVDKIEVGRDVIDEVSPEILITNREDLPEEISVALGKVSRKPLSRRKLVIIYPDKNVFSFDFIVGYECTILVESLKKKKNRV